MAVVKQGDILISNKYPTLFSEYEGAVVQVIVAGAAFKVLVTVNC